MKAQAKKTQGARKAASKVAHKAGSGTWKIAKTGDVRVVGRDATGQVIGRYQQALRKLAKH